MPMRKSRFTEEQIAHALRQAETGTQLSRNIVSSTIASTFPIVRHWLNLRRRRCVGHGSSAYVTNTSTV